MGLPGHPITAANAGRQVWTRANAGEILPGVVTPLSWSVFRAVLQGAGWYSGLFPLTLHWRWRLPTGDWADSPRLFSGRAYMELHSVYASFGGYPGVTPWLLQKALGFEFSLLAPEELPKRRPRWHGMDLYRAARFWAEMYGLTTSVQNTRQRLQKGSAKLLEKQIDGMKPAELLALAGALQGQAARMLGLHITCTALTFSAYGLYIDHLRKRGSSAAALASLEQLLVADATQISTARHLQAIWELACAVRANPGALEILLQTQPIQEVPPLWRASPGAGEVVRLWENFLEQFGGRGTQEFELSAPRWKEDPAIVLAAVKDAIQSQRGDPAREFSASPERETLVDLNTDWRARRLYQAYSNFVPLRENLKYDVVVLFDKLRQIYLRLGQILSAQKQIDDAEDIFFLDQAEIRDHISGVPIEPLGELVAQHQKTHRIWQERTAPAVIIRVGGKNQPLDPAPADDAHVLHGIACSGGIVTAPAAILHHLDGSQTIPHGHILVTPSIDPGLTPLLLNAAGLVTEIGGILSHGATLAREFGLPAVVSVAGITQAVQDGQIITLDGFTGAVRVHPPGAAGGAP